jgi:pyruvate dehydrogenase E2 component (dihydrolipoamide acetyltransferase)
MNLSQFFAGFQEVALDLEALGVDTEPIVAAINPGAGAVEATVIGFITLAQKIGTLFGTQVAANAASPAAPVAAAAPAPVAAAPAAPAPVSAAPAPVVVFPAPAPAEAAAPVDESQVIKPGPGLIPVKPGV